MGLPGVIAHDWRDVPRQTLRQGPHPAVRRPDVALVWKPRAGKVRDLRTGAQEDNVRVLARRLAITIVSASVAVAGLASPARAATNPFTAAQACNNDFGGSWANTSDGHRAISASDGTKVGDVYLMYNSATGYNCVVTLKAVAIGTSTGLGATLTVQGSGTYTQSGNYKYYAAKQHSAVDTCVKYQGDVLYTTMWEGAGRDTWGNCG
jgi:hypothetical protein